MKVTSTRSFALVAPLLLLVCGVSAHAQSFVNLDFEQARLPPGEPGVTQFLSWTQAAPGWSHSEGDSTEGVFYPEGHLGFSQGFVLRGAPGSFAMGMRSGNLREGEPDSPWVHAFIAQRGLIPAGAREILVDVSNFRFELHVDGQPLAMRPARPGVGVEFALEDYDGDWTGDVSAFAGRTVELKIVDAAPEGDFGHILVVDDIRILPIPEPTTSALMGAGLSMLLLLRRPHMERWATRLASGAGARPS